jgi:mono/diheme cytochrome c family protein
MTRVVVLGLSAGVLGLGLSVRAVSQAPASPSAPTRPPAIARPVGERPVAAPSHTPPLMTAAVQSELVDTYCASCHSERAKAGGLSLAGFDAMRATERADVVEKMIRKLRAGMMPPAGARRPDGATIDALTAGLERRMDEFAAVNPNPGSRPSQRLNRAEYARAVKDLVGLDVDVTAFLPADTISHGFDNVADAQRLSPTVLEGYLRAASQISRLAVGDRTATPTSTTFKTARTASQHRHVEGTPLGTRGGLAVTHVFPADGDYTFRMMLHAGPTGQLFGGPYPGEQLEVSIDGARVALLDINPRMDEADPNGMNLFTTPVHVTAGPHRVAAAFVNRFDGPVDDLVMPIEHTLADTNIGEVFGVTALVHLRDLAITGPHTVTGVSDTVSRRMVFSCRPATPGEEAACARAIVARLARQAYRGAVSAGEIDGLLKFYAQGRGDGDFESGIRTALQAVLASPRFLFRLEQTPASARPGQTYQLAAADLASRLSFFIWGGAPDDALLQAAGTLHTPAGMQTQVARLLKDPRSEALATRFAHQWLRLQDVDKVRPDHHFAPHWDTTLSAALVRETELFFDSLVRDDRSILELVSADYTYANDRVAKHYGLPNVTGAAFRKVPVPDYRRGILGHGSILLATSFADRTSPVNRGKWVMEVLLGSPPPPPPPNVPALEDTKGSSGGRLLTVRERMEQHRANPACTSCHKVIDPLGLALENFDLSGRWRSHDSLVPVDAKGTLYDGLPIDGPAGLRAALLTHKDAFLLSFTEHLMTYALGRRVETFDMPVVRAIIRDAAAHDYRISAFVAGIARSAPFRTARLEPAVTTDAPAQR